MAQRIGSGFALAGTGKSQPRHILFYWHKGLVLGLPWRVQANPSLAIFCFNGTKDWFWVCPGAYRQIPASPYFVSIQLLVSASLSGGFLFQFWKALRSTPKARQGAPPIST